MISPRAFIVAYVLAMLVLMLAGFGIGVLIQEAF